MSSSAIARDFSATSTNADFADALAKAIAEAKNGLKTDLVVWELKSLTGRDGGYILVTELTVTISARAGNEAAG